MDIIYLKRGKHMDRQTTEQMLANYKGIYGTMYGTTYIDGPEYYVKDKIIFIEKEKLRITDKGLIFVWGYPGPDFNYYLWDEYGKTWAFNECEIEEVPTPNRYIPCRKCIRSPMWWGDKVSLPKECPRSKEILSKRFVMDEKFDGCCKNGAEDKNRHVIYPKYIPRNEDLYDITFTKCEGE